MLMEKGAQPILRIVTAFSDDRIQYSPSVSYSLGANLTADAIRIELVSRIFVQSSLGALNYKVNKKIRTDTKRLNVI